MAYLIFLTINLYAIWLIKFSRWVPVNLISKISDGWIRDLGFNPRLY